MKSRDLPGVIATDKLLDEVGHGGYTGGDAAGRMLTMWRNEVLGGALSREPGQRDPWYELVTALAAGSLMFTLGGIAVILAASATAGIMMLVMAASWAAIAGVIMRVATSPR